MLKLGNKGMEEKKEYLEGCNKIGKKVWKELRNFNEKPSSTKRKRVRPWELEYYWKDL